MGHTVLVCLLAIQLFPHLILLSPLFGSLGIYSPQNLCQQCSGTDPSNDMYSCDVEGRNETGAV